MRAVSICTMNIFCVLTAVLSGELIFQRERGGEVDRAREE